MLERSSSDHENLSDLLTVTPQMLLESRALLGILWASADPERDPNWREAVSEASHLALCQQVLHLFHTLASAALTAALEPAADGSGCLLRGCSRSDLHLLDEILSWRSFFAINDRRLYESDDLSDPALDEVLISEQRGSDLAKIGDAARHLLRLAADGPKWFRQCRALVHEYPDQQCGRLFILEPRSGRPKEFCSDECFQANRRIQRREQEKLRPHREREPRHKSRSISGHRPVPPSTVR